MTYCTSCGSSIPDGQGSSCSMCFGDIEWGNDNYYREWAEREEREHQELTMNERKEALDHFSPAPASPPKEGVSPSKRTDAE